QPRNFTVRVDDGRGGVDTQRFTVVGSAVNAPFLYTANFRQSAIEGYSATGADLGVWESNGLNQSVGLALDRSGNLYVSNGGDVGSVDNTVHRYSPTGQDLGVFASTGLSGPEGLAFDKAGNLYVGNYVSGTIRRFSP